MQAALLSVKGVSKAEVGAKTGNAATTVVTAAEKVKVKALIKALEKKGFGATEEEAKKEAA